MHVQNDVNLHMARMLEGTFSLERDHILGLCKSQKENDLLCLRNTTPTISV